MTDTFTKKYLAESIELIHRLDTSAIEAMAEGLGLFGSGTITSNTTRRHRWPLTRGAPVR